MQALIDYLRFNGSSISVLFNTLTGGQPYQSFSARNWERKRNGQINCVWLIDTIYFLEGPHHCMEKWVYWRTRYDIIKENESEIELREREITLDYELRCREGDFNGL